MILAIVLTLCGILLIPLIVLLRRRLGRKWILRLLTIAVLVGGSGALILYGTYVQRQENKETLYLGLNYLEKLDLDSAGFYLLQVDATKGFVPAAARTALAQALAHEQDAKTNWEIANEKSISTVQRDMVSILRDMNPSNYKDSLAGLADQLIQQLNLPEKRINALNLFLQLENGETVNEQDLKALSLGKDEADRIRISGKLRLGKYGEAVHDAVALADLHSTEANRLLLAEAVAEAGYAGYPLTDQDFARAEARERQSPTQNAAPTDPSDNPFLHRAFSSISGLNSLQARILRARLHFALLDYDEAVDTLLQAARSIRAKLSTDETLKDRLQILSDAYARTGGPTVQSELEDTISSLLTASFPDLMALSQSTLTRDFTQWILQDLPS